MLRQSQPTGIAGAAERDSTASIISAKRDSATPVTGAHEDLGNVSWFEIVLLHLGPGALAMAFLLVVAPNFARAGFPPDLGVVLGTTVVATFARLAYLLYRGSRRSGRWTLHGAIAPWWRRMPVWQFASLYLLLAASALGLVVLYSPVRNYLASQLFGWFPAYLRPGWDPVNAGFARGALLTWGILLLVMDGVVSPIVEELYFRGHLLPRMLPRLGWWAPVASAAFFGLQHFAEPFNVPFIFLLFVVVGSVITWKRNLGLGIALHITLNVSRATLILISILAR